MTRVGLGPFPTEMGGKTSDDWCNDSQTIRELEEGKYPNPSINSPDDFELGLAVRRSGGEFGTTTGRPRRTGWLDLPLLRYAIRFTGANLILTKVDVLDSCGLVKICTSYRYDGPDYRLGDRTLRKGDTLQVAIPDPDVLEHCRPNYHQMPGWQCSTQRITSVADLPKNLQSIVRFIEGAAGVSVKATSHGPGRDEVVIWS